VLVRDAEHDPEILLVRRRSGEAFGEAHTFPGGVLDDNESDATKFCTGLPAEEADALLAVDSGGLDYFSAVARELYEETGVLLDTSRPVDANYRKRLYRGELAWSDFLGREELVIPCDTLLYFTHWITPEGLSRRWSTRFFLAAAPPGQVVVPDHNEITDYCWVTAEEALASAECGDRKIPFPTRKTVAALAGKKSLSELIEWVRQRQAHGIRSIQPEIREKDGKQRIFMPEIAD
jgi:8-oxo-dGTP pyrophosphatase MutT (NUDIX family)